MTQSTPATQPSSTAAAESPTRIAGHTVQDVVDALCAPAGRKDGARMLREIYLDMTLQPGFQPNYIPAPPETPVEALEASGHSINDIIDACADPSTRITGVKMIRTVFNLHARLAREVTP